MLIRSGSDIKGSEITPEPIYLRRREFMLATAVGMLGLSSAAQAAKPSQDDQPLLAFKPASAADIETGFNTAEAHTPFDDITQYNNFYEFGTGKSDPARHAGAMQTRPWHVVVEGEVARPGRYALEDLIDPMDLEERIYRLRCVEAWSMVIPWVGFPLAALIKRLQPTSRAKYVGFETLYRPRQMRGQRSATSFIEWPYVEGLRMDEALHPLTLLAVGLYGRQLPNQNGAPLRLVVPWKYGFKSIKSIVRIRFQENRPPTTWNRSAPGEYGFYANVNPDVDHPRWSQKHERRLPSSLFSPNRIPTRLFNGYADQVAGLYRGLDLNRHY